MTSNVPIFDPDRGFRLWLLPEIYDGTDEGGVYVPNVNDAVLDWDTGLYRVTHVDIESGISQLIQASFPSVNPGMSEDDILMGISPSRPSEVYRVYINSSVDPITAAIDSRLHIYGSENMYVRLFEGSDISESGTVISLYYDNDGRLTDDKYPLELVSTIHEDNIAVKTSVHGYIAYKLDDGELVTAVVYNSSGGVTSINPLLSTDTKYVRPPTKETRHVTNIELSSPFITANDPLRLEVPLHTPIDTLNLLGIVRYSDGSSRHMPIDGTKFSIAGLEVFTISLSGQTIPLVLTYNLSPEEASYASTSDDGSSISKLYHLTTTSPEYAYSVKLFVLPLWDNYYNHWGLTYYLYNLVRDTSLDVTDLVKTGSVDGITYNPNLYGETQRLTVAIDMELVSDEYLAFRHVQTYEIALIGPPAETIPSWTLRYNPGFGEIYGQDILITAVVRDTEIEMDLKSGINSIEEWLDLMYRPAYPLFDAVLETGPPMPTHVDIIYRDTVVSIEIHEFNQLITLPTIPIDGDNLWLRWYIRTEANELELAITPATVRYNL